MSYDISAIKCVDENGMGVKVTVDWSGQGLIVSLKSYLDTMHTINRPLKSHGK